MNFRPPIALSLTPVLRCPNLRCNKIPFGVSSDLLTLTCQFCKTHWWATRFDAGDVRAQALQQFEGSTEFAALLDRFEAPSLTETPMYLQIRLTGNELYRFTTRTTSIREHSMALIRALLSGRSRAA